MKKVPVVLAALIAVTLSAGCSHSSTPAAVASPSVTTTDPSATGTSNTGPIGSTLRVWSGSSTIAEYTVTNVRPQDGGTRIDVTVIARQVNSNTDTIGVFSALSSSGAKVDQKSPSVSYNTEPPTHFGLDWSGTMVTGETRSGYVDFPITGITTIYLTHGDGPPAASWSVK